MQRNGSGAFISRPPYSRTGLPAYGKPGDGHHRRPYVPAYRSGYGYGVVGYPIPWIGPGDLGDPDLGYPDADEGDQASAQADSGAENAGAYDEPPYQQALPPYLPAQVHPASVLPPQQAVTLIFKDGRAPEQIHNYILTGTILYVGDRRPSEIPLDQLDLKETTRVNQDAGVDFQMPAGLR
jgi:hypothetical protein